MEDQVETVGEQLLIHVLEQLVAGYAGLVRNAVDVEAVFAEPFRLADDLFVMNAIGNADDVLQGRVRAGNVASFALKTLPLSCRVRIGQLYRGDQKA